MASNLSFSSCFFAALNSDCSRTGWLLCRPRKMLLMKPIAKIVAALTAYIVGFSISLTADAGGLPDSLHTPGAVDPAVTQDNIDQTICVPGYTKTVRPRTSYTSGIKRELLNNSYKGQGERRLVELDHLIPLIAGGHPTSPENLWPQPYGGEYDARYKDRCEVTTGRAICQGSVGLVEAQKGFSVNWIEWCKQLM